MATFKRCDSSVEDMASEVMGRYECFAPLLDHKVKLDFVFAYPEYDELTGEPTGDALKKNGCKALGITRKLSLKDRALGRGDAEISLDGEWWDNASDDERAALLDHELYHLVVVPGKTDDLRRPVLKLRPHDFEVGWFAAVAERHGIHSQERKQATAVMEAAGQFFWPSIIGVSRFGSVELQQVHVASKAA